MRRCLRFALYMYKNPPLWGEKGNHYERCELSEPC